MLSKAALEVGAVGHSRWCRRWRSCSFLDGIGGFPRDRSCGFFSSGGVSAFVSGATLAFMNCMAFSNGRFCELTARV